MLGIKSNLYEVLKFMVKGIFITATGTDVGKTFVSALLVKKMKDYGFNCGYYKPVLSGAEEINGTLTPGDCAYVKKIANLEGNAQDFVSYMFKPALSPHLASQIENNPIDLEFVKKDFSVRKNKYEYIVTEGAGGIVCPMNLSGDKPFLIEDIIKGLHLDVIIVAPAELGSINSAVLTAEYAKNHGIKVNGIILNNFDKTDKMQTDNKIQIEKLTHIPVIATVEKNSSDIEIDKNTLVGIFREI